MSKGDRNRSCNQAYRDGWERVFGAGESAEGAWVCHEPEPYKFECQATEPGHEIQQALAAARDARLFVVDGGRCYMRPGVLHSSVVDDRGVTVATAPTVAGAIMRAIEKVKDHV